MSLTKTISAETKKLGPLLLEGVLLAYMCTWVLFHLAALLLATLFFLQRAIRNGWRMRLR